MHYRDLSKAQLIYIIENCLGYSGRLPSESRLPEIVTEFEQQNRVAKADRAFDSYMEALQQLNDVKAPYVWMKFSEISISELEILSDAETKVRKLFDEYVRLSKRASAV